MKFLNKSKFGICFIIIGLLIQTLGLFQGVNWVAYISGCFGIIAVVLCSEKKYSSLLFGIPQLLTYIYICIDQHLYGEIGINLFYLVAMVFALFTWNKGKDEEGVIKSLTLSKYGNLLSIVASIFFTYILYRELLKTNDSQPFMDALTTGPAIVAQILMTLKYKEQWIYWLIIDIAAIVMWSNAGNIFMVIQYVFWSINCIYGYYCWNKK